MSDLERLPTEAEEKLIDLEDQTLYGKFLIVKTSNKPKDPKIILRIQNQKINENIFKMYSNKHLPYPKPIR